MPRVHKGYDTVVADHNWEAPMLENAEHSAKVGEQVCEKLETNLKNEEDVQQRLRMKTAEFLKKEQYPEPSEEYIAHKALCSTAKKRLPWTEELDTRKRRQAVEHTPGAVTEIFGDLLSAPPEIFLAHQCNCVGRGPAAGIAAAVFAAYPSADVYIERKTEGRQREKPGTFSFHDRIINLYAQPLPGKPAEEKPQKEGGWHQSVPGAAGDTRAARLLWFRECLQQIPAGLPESTEDGARIGVAFPARIGCGLAQGEWAAYRREIWSFASENTALKVIIYDNRPEMTTLTDNRKSAKNSEGTPIKKETPIPALTDVVVSPVDGDVKRRTLRTRAGFLLTLLLFLMSNPAHYIISHGYSPAQLARWLGHEALISRHACCEAGGATGLPAN